MDMEPRLLSREEVKPVLAVPKDRWTHADTIADCLERFNVLVIPKVDSAVAAIKAGVEKVSFVDGRVPHAVLLEIFTDDGVGPEVVQ